MGFTLKPVGLTMPVLLFVLVLSQNTCLRRGYAQPGGLTNDSTPSIAMLTTPTSVAKPVEPNSVLVYIKIVINKKYGVLAHLLGGMRDSTWRRTAYDAANPWWRNPLIVYADTPYPDADVIGQADADPIIGQGVSQNVEVGVLLTPHADVAVKTSPKSDGIKGTITTTISTLADYYDGGWTEMVHVNDRRVTFSFDTCAPHRQVEAIGHETRTVSAISLERYTREQEKWEPKTDWPTQPQSGDWRVVIYGKDATLHLTHYRYVEPSLAESTR